MLKRVLLLLSACAVLSVPAVSPARSDVSVIRSSSAGFVGCVASPDSGQQLGCLRAFQVEGGLYLRWRPVREDGGSDLGDLIADRDKETVDPNGTVVVVPTSVYPTVEITGQIPGTGEVSLRAEAQQLTFGRTFCCAEVIYSIDSDDPSAWLQDRPPVGASMRHVAGTVGGFQVREFRPGSSVFWIGSVSGVASGMEF